MTGAWERAALRGADRVEVVQLQTIASGLTTLISAAQSGESIALLAIELENSTPLSSVNAIVNAYDANSTQVVIARHDFQLASGSYLVPGPYVTPPTGPDPDNPIYVVGGLGFFDVRGTLSGAIHAKAWFMRDT